ncbi:MAG: hypothetical protein FD128_2587, partial [Hyphomonadaceae bacterium]
CVGFAPKGDGLHPILAHRGVHQTFSNEGLTNATCTAERIDPPRHEFLENTIPSLRETIRLGADIIEVDVHPTTDGDFAVFHDWTIDCRTEGHGVTREQTMAYLRTLDVGYGYTADGGRTYPLRSKGIGLMPSLAEVLEAADGITLMINIKSNEASEGVKLAAYLKARNVPNDKIIVYGGGLSAIETFRRDAPQYSVFSGQSVKECGVQYMKNAWRNGPLEKCRNGVLIIPVSHRHLFWGYNSTMVARLNAVNARVFIAGPAEGIVPKRPGGLDDPMDIKHVPNGAGIFTNAIEVIGPAIKNGKKR